MFFRDSFESRLSSGTGRLRRVLALLVSLLPLMPLVPLVPLVLFALPARAAGVASAAPAAAAPGKPPSWGAIASMDGSYGFSFNQPSRALAEIAARAQCDRAAGRPATCAVRAYFDRSCGAYATGNYGEWATGLGPTAVAASKEAATQCDAHLPTQPCKVVFSVCSPP